ncbi:MAG: hypothetical protein KDA45_04550 [Planctomycetales bacterium]|nr:hypothetical protein [Planctomycetales bacterium]
MHVHARAWGHEKVGLPQVLELVSNTGILHEVRRNAQSSDELSLEVEVDISRSTWLALSTRCANGALAHSTPIYVVVDDEPTWSPQESERIVSKQLDAIALIEAEFSQGSDIRSRAIRERLERAKTYYSKLLAATERALRE